MRTLDPTRGEIILESAARLFHQRHYHEVRVEDIAASAGVAKGTVYRYFEDKEALYLALILSGLNRFIADIEPMMADDQPADDRLRTYIHRSIAFCDRSPYFIELVQRVEGTTCPDRLAPLQEARQRLASIVADVIRQLDGVRGYRVRNPQISAIAFIGMLRQTLRFLPKPWPENLPEILAEQFLHGIRPV